MLKSIKDFFFGNKKPAENDTPRLFVWELHAITCGICTASFVNNDFVVGYKNSYYHQACWNKEQTDSIRGRTKDVIYVDDQNNFNSTETK